MGTPFFSVVMPVYNGAKFLPDALAALKQQEPFDGGWEVVAADDGSIDGSRELLETAAKELPLRVVNGARCGNWVASTNKAMDLCRGEWLVFLHQDDAFAPSRLRRLREESERCPECGFLVNDTRFLGVDGRDLGSWRAPLRAGFSPPVRCVPPTLVQNNFAVPGVAVKRAWLEAIGRLDESLCYTADWDAWLCVMERCGVVRIPEALSFFRIHSDSQTVADFATHSAEMRRNLETVEKRHFPALSTLLPAHHVAKWKRMARLGIETDLFLAAVGMKAPLPWRPFLRAAFNVGPHRWPAFLCLSRTVQRALPRFRSGIHKQAR